MYSWYCAEKPSNSHSRLPELLSTSTPYEERALANANKKRTLHQHDMLQTRTCQIHLPSRPRSGCCSELVELLARLCSHCPASFGGGIVKGITSWCLPRLNVWSTGRDAPHERYPPRDGAIVRCDPMAQRIDMDEDVGAGTLSGRRSRRVYCSLVRRTHGYGCGMPGDRYNSR